MTEAGDIDPVYRGECRPVDLGVAELAERQHGAVARRQLLELGLGSRAIDHRVAVGRLHPVHAGVYLVGHRLRSARTRWMAAVLACGPGALLSHRPAADVWHLLPTDSARIHVVADRSTRGPAGIVVHRIRRLHIEDRAERDGIPVTSVARTLLDLAGVVRRRQLERAVETAERHGLFDLHAMERLLASGRGRRGVRMLRSVLRDYREPPFTRSELERMFIALCRGAGLPPPVTNLWVAGGEADATWPDHRLVVELDSRGYHATRAAFERDRRRDTDLQLAGYRVLRVTHRRLEQEPADVAAAVGRLLGVPSS